MLAGQRFQSRSSYRSTIYQFVKGIPRSDYQTALIIALKGWYCVYKLMQGAYFEEMWINFNYILFSLNYLIPPVSSSVILYRVIPQSWVGKQSRMIPLSAIKQFTNCKLYTKNRYGDITDNVCWTLIRIC